MDSIKCSKHPECEALFICQKCGFLCREDKGKEDNDRHKLLTIDYNIKDLYKAIAVRAIVHEKSSFITKLKESLCKFLDQEGNANDKNRVTIQENERKCYSEIQEINRQIIVNIISKDIEKNHQNDQKYNQNDISRIIEIIRKLLKFKVLNQKCDIKYKKIQILSIQKRNSKRAFSKLNAINILKKQQKEPPKYESDGNKSKIEINEPDSNLIKHLGTSNKKYIESQWKEIYDALNKKYKESNPIIENAQILLKYKNKEQCKLVIENVEGEILLDDGAIAIGYALRKNNSCQSVSLL